MLRHHGAVRQMAGGTWRALAQQARRLVEQQLVHQPLAQQRTVELVAGFDVHFVDLAPRQFHEQGGQIDSALRIRQPQHAGAAITQGLLALGVGASAGDANAAPWHLPQTRVQRRAQPAVGNHQQDRKSVV